MFDVILSMHAHVVEGHVSQSQKLCFFLIHPQIPGSDSGSATILTVLTIWC